MSLDETPVIFATEKVRRPHGRYTLRQSIRVLDRCPPN
jgi:hypothetical protein